MLEVRHLTTLLAIEEAGSLMEAAERLHVTQSALSHQLKDLEGRLGAALLVRRTRPVQFTTAGLRVLALAREVLPRVQQTERELKRLAAGQTGRLHMADAGPGCVPRTLARGGDGSVCGVQLCALAGAGAR